MTKRKRKKARKLTGGRVEARKPVNVGPTPETLAKLEADPLQIMIDAGQIDSAGENAIEEIRRIWNALTYELEAKVGSYSDTMRGKREMPDDVAQAYSERYKPWARETYPASELVIQIVTQRADTKSPELRTVVADTIENYARRF